MLANLLERVEQLARMTALSDSGDLPGLVALQEQAVSLATDLEGEKQAEVSELAKKIAELAEAIVLRKSPDVAGAFRDIGSLIDRMQTEAGRPEGAAPAADFELIAAWVTNCDGTLSDLEGLLLTIEKNPGDREVLADIRRSLHTLKGECGVLSLHTAQHLCHEAESLIDERLDAGATVPVGPLLKLMDWMKGYSQKLSSSPTASPDGHEPLLAQLSAARCGSPAGTPPAPVRATDGTSAPTSAPAPAPADTRIDPTPIVFAAQAGTEENLPDFLCEAKEHLTNSEEALLALDQDRGNKELINTVFRAFHTIKGVSGFMALKPVVALAHSAEQLLDGARGGTLSLNRPELDLILASCDMMTKLLAVLEGASGPARGDFDMLVNRLDGAARGGASEATQAPAARAEPGPAAPAATQRDTRSADAPVPSPAAPADAEGQPAAEAEASGASRLRKSDQTVKVNTSRMDSLVTMVGELVIAQQMVVQDMTKLLGPGGGNPRVQRTLGHMSKMIRDLQEVSMSLRMVNLKSTFQRMTRLVRDVSQKAGKQIEVFTEGEDVELDRNVVEAITDPLVHMIRNSCDHGVEGADERRAAGKAATGRVSLRAYHAGGSIVIEIGDDGRGLRREKLLAKARAKGLIHADVADASMPDSEVFSLIFLPGFSTAETVTDISGRGVGMDVVRRNIEALRGKIEIRSTPGEGTTFLLRLPLTMAIIDGMVVRVGSQRYVLPTLSIQQSFRPKAGDLKTAVGVGEMVRVRGNMLPVYRLNRTLGLHEGTRSLEDALLIVMEADDLRFCLMVDEILGQQQVVIKTLTQTGQQLRGVSGGAILGDGRVALILDVPQVASLAREGAGAVAEPREQGVPLGSA